MRKNSKKTVLHSTVREQCRMIFNHPQPPSTIWEPEFDYDDAALQRLGRKPWQTITANELHGYYVLNLVYHIPLQPELFNYLFPICLAFWQESLFTPGDSGLIDELYRAFARPYIWQEMMSNEQR